MKNLLFIHIPKNMGSSMVEYFRLNHQISYNSSQQYNFDNNSNVSFGHVDINILLREKILSLEFYKNSFKFCIVRNPYSRAVSLFFYLKENEYWRKYYLKYSFKSWVDHLYNNKDHIPQNGNRNISYSVYHNIDNRWNLMISWIPNDIDNIYHFEDGMSSIIKDICKKTRIKMNSDLVHINKSSHNSFIKYYDNETQRKIYEIYEKDFIRFNYSKDINLIIQKT